MLRYLIGCAAALAIAGPAAAQVQGEETRMCGGYGAPHPDMPPEFGQFAFIIGDYDVGLRPWNLEAGEWDEPQFYARWNGRYGFGGRAIIDEWYDPGYGYRPQSGAGVNIRLWDAGEGLWKTAWIHTGDKETRELHQQVKEDGLLYLWQIYPEVPERNVFFETYQNGEWARITKRKDETSGEWVNQTKLHAVPAACPARE